MKGKIYKNKLNSTSPINTPIEHLNTQISSILPLHSHYNQSNSPTSHILSPKNQNPKKSFIYQLTDNLNLPNRNNPNHTIKTFIDHLDQQSTIDHNQKNHHQTNAHRTMNHMLVHMNSPHQEKLNINNQRQTGSASLKRVVSNPNINSYQFLAMQQNKEQEIDPIDQASILDKSSHSNFSKFKPTTHYNTRNNNQFNLFDNYQEKNCFVGTHPISHLPSQQQFTVTSPYKSPACNQNGLPNALLEGSNFFYHNDNSFMRPNQQCSQTDYITQYEKRHKERVSALESQHELQVQFYEEQIKTREQTIEEMRRVLREKQEIIKRLQSENANLSSRSYISFANGNICGKD